MVRYRIRKGITHECLVMTARDVERTILSEYIYERVSPLA